MSANQIEKLAYWFLRLNGYLRLPPLFGPLRG